MMIFMSMFKYISEIIQNISPKQRLFALFITLVFILLITLGGNVIDAFKSRDSVLENRIKTLEIANLSLNQQNHELNQVVLKSQLDCARDITNVRKQILDEILLLESEMKNISNPFVRRTLPIQQGSTGSDSLVQSLPPPIVIETPVNTQAVDHLRKMKKQLQEDINKTEL
jgi:hypothetical protein